MMTSDDKVGGWVKKGQNHDDVILECPQTKKVLHYKPRLVTLGLFMLRSFKIQPDEVMNLSNCYFFGY